MRNRPTGPKLDLRCGHYRAVLMSPDRVSDNWVQWVGDPKIMLPLGVKPHTSDKRQLARYVVENHARQRAIIGIFGVIALGSVVLVVILVRSRHTFAVRPFHSGICIYIASFAPYALLKAVAVYRLLQADTQEQELTAELMLSGTFMIFFCLGFGGKMALIQLWMHLISRHTAGGSQQLLVASARQTWKFMRLTVLLVCVLYSAGFIAI